MTIGDDFKILSDKTTDGVRHITAVPSAIVCSAQIDFDLIEGKIHNLRYIKGCDGNLQAIGEASGGDGGRQGGRDPVGSQLPRARDLVLRSADSGAA